MPPGPLVFVDIDTQRDFLDPEGALFVADSVAILDNLTRLTEFARRRRIPVIATACSHATDDPEMATFGLHCLAGSPGQARVPATSWAGDDGKTLGAADPFDPAGPLAPHLTVEKREYDVFSHPGADSLFARYAEGAPTFVVYGVTTDYCVKAAVLGLLDRGCRVAVVVDAVRPIDREGEPVVLAELIRRGALLTLTDVVCGGGNLYS